MPLPPPAVIPSIHPSLAFFFLSALDRFAAAEAASPSVPRSCLRILPLEVLDKAPRDETTRERRSLLHVWEWDLLGLHVRSAGLAGSAPAEEWNFRFEKMLFLGLGRFSIQKSFSATIFLAVSSFQGSIWVSFEAPLHLVAHLSLMQLALYLSLSHCPFPLSRRNRPGPTFPLSLPSERTQRKWAELLSAVPSSPSSSSSVPGASSLLVLRARQKV